MKKVLTAISVVSLFFILCMSANAASCPKGAKEYKGHTYYVYSGNYTWKKAKSICESKGGHLATITSSGENKAVAKMISSSNLSKCWLGATDESKEGTWKWVTGEKFSYKSWAKNEPNNENNAEHYMGSYDSSSEWNDYRVDTSSVNGFVCEWDCTKEKANKPRFAKSSENVYYGATKTLKLFNNTKTIKWSSSNKEVATVNSKGVVSGKGLGSATIYAKVGKSTYKVTVKVTQKNYAATATVKTTDGGYFIPGTGNVNVSFKVKDGACAKVTVSIVSSDGTTIYRKNFSSVKKNTTYSFVWNGKDTKGKLVSTGSYRAKVTVGTKNSYSKYISAKKNDFAGGNGSKSKPFIVTSATHLKKIIKYPAGYFKQTKDIKCNYESVKNAFTSDNRFTGVYDGGNKKIYNISSNSALFAFIGEKGTVKNVVFNGCTSVGERAAIIAIENYGKISNCKAIKCSTSSTVRSGICGVLVALNSGMITNCESSGASSVNTGSSKSGGIAGYNLGTGKIIDCTSSANISGASDYTRVGGIVGINDGVVSNCEASGVISVVGYFSNQNYLGGVTGLNNSQIIDCIYTGTSTVNLAGENNGAII